MNSLQKIAMNRSTIVAIGIILTILPFLRTTVPPIADLPQQVAQIRLLSETIGDPNSPYVIDWYAPGRMSYLFLGAAWKMVSPWHVGRLAMIFISMVWVFSIHRFAKCHSRPVTNTTLACVFLFSSTLYWGFLNFILGMPFFLLWFSICKNTVAAPASSRKFLFIAGQSMGLSLLLFYTHPLWFAAALVWLVIFSVHSYKQIKSHLPRIIGVIPVGIFALIWFPRLNKMGFTSETLWGLNPWERIFSGWVFHASLGGLTGLIEPCVLTAMALWVAIGIFQNRYVLRDQFDINLLLCATLFILAALVLPVKFSNTLAFCDRWLPVGLSLLLLACPAPTLPKGMDKILALAVLATFCVATSTAWLDFERHEFSGITEAIADLPPGQRVIGVDLIQTSDKIKVWQPFIQTFAYAQVVKGGSLNFSFADFPNSLVYYSPPRRITWTRGLEWDGAKTTPYDLLQFDYALVGVRPDSAKEYQSLLSDLSPISKMGYWRLYKTKRSMTKGR